jgi:FkbM family methyltransferase
MSFLGAIKRATNRLLIPWLNHRIEYATSIPDFGRLVVHLQSAQLTPKTIFDVGVADGTPWLYDTFPQAHFFLFDPTPQSLPYMNSVAKRLKADVFNVALGDKSGTIALNVWATHSDSSIFDEVGRADILEHRDVPMRRFGELVTSFARPSLMKIDVQGAELMVLRGMGERLKEIDCLIVETSLIATVHDGPEFAEVAGFMNNAGFVLFDIVAVNRRPLDLALAQMDAVFVPETSPLRRDHRWTV